MKSLFLLFPLLVVAKGHGHLAVAVASVQASSSATVAPVASKAPASNVPPAAEATEAPSATQLPTVAIHPLSVNPTAIPIDEIVFTLSTQPTVALSPTFPAGAQQTLIPNAPSLPSLDTFNPYTDYPPLDKTPDVTTPQVQQWIAEVAASGIDIPDFSPTNPGGCPANENIVSNTSRCWWTCSLCTRDTDITTCPSHLTWGLTFDDGPGPWTPNLLDYLQQLNLMATFFIIGSRATERAAMVQSEYLLGHQIGVHTWSHPALTTLTTEEIIAELGWTKKLLKELTGVTPNTMRPPYGDIDDRVRAISLAMGLTPVIWTSTNGKSFDTNDWSVAEGTVSSSQVVANFENILTLAPGLTTGFIVLAHDLFAQTVDIATGYTLPEALAFKPHLTIQNIITCLGLPLSDAYIETNNNATNPPPNAGASNASAIISGTPPVSSSPTASGSTTTPTSNAANQLTSSPSVMIVSALGALALIHGLGH